MAGWLTQVNGSQQYQYHGMATYALIFHPGRRYDVNDFACIFVMGHEVAWNDADGLEQERKVVLWWSVTGEVWAVWNCDGDCPTSGLGKTNTCSASGTARFKLATSVSVAGLRSASLDSTPLMTWILLVAHGWVGGFSVRSSKNQVDEKQL